MRSRSLIVVGSLILALSVVPGVVAQEEPAEAESLLEWDESPAGYLLTKDEQKEWKKVSTEAEARAFIELFWAKRNPDPASAFNPFKADFENKVRYADEQYTWDSQMYCSSSLCLVTTVTCGGWGWNRNSSAPMPAAAQGAAAVQRQACS